MWQVAWSDSDNRWLSSHILFSWCVVWTCNSGYHCKACLTAFDIPGCRFQALTICSWVSVIMWILLYPVMHLQDSSQYLWHVCSLLASSHYCRIQERAFKVDEKMETDIGVIYGNYEILHSPFYLSAAWWWVHSVWILYICEQSVKLLLLYWLALQCRWLHWQQQIGLNPLFLCRVSHGPLPLQYLRRYAR